MNQYAFKNVFPEEDKLVDKVDTDNNLDIKIDLFIKMLAKVQKITIVSNETYNRDLTFDDSIKIHEGV